MKATALLLLAFAVVAVVGCSDNSTPPVSPTDESIQAAVPLQKNVIRKFTGEEGPDPINPALVLSPLRTVDGGMMFQSLQERTYFRATFLDGGDDPVSGNGVLELNYKFNPNTLEGFTWGKLTVDPWNDDVAGADAVWEISWHGKMWVDQTGITVAPLQWVGHGKGGAVNGMQLFGDDTIYMKNFVDWVGKNGQNCYVKEH